MFGITSCPMYAMYFRVKLKRIKIELLTEPELDQTWLDLDLTWPELHSKVPFQVLFELPSEVPFVVPLQVYLQVPIQIPFKILHM